MLEVRFDADEILRQNLVTSPRSTAGFTRIRHPENGILLMEDGDGPAGYETVPYVRFPTVSALSQEIWRFTQALSLPVGSPYPFIQMRVRSGTGTFPVQFTSRLEYDDGSFSDWGGAGSPASSFLSTSWGSVESYRANWRNIDWVTPKPVVSVQARIRALSQWVDTSALDVALQLIEVGPTFPLNSSPMTIARPYFDGNTPPAGGGLVKWTGVPNDSTSIVYVPSTKAVESTAVSLTRDLGWSSTSAGIMATTASMQVEDIFKPFGDGPRPGDMVRVSDGGATIFTGTIERIAGTVNAGQATVDAVDAMDRLSRKVVHGEWMSRISTPDGIKWPGLSDVTIIDEVLANAGFESTPRPVGSIFLAPLQGSAWLPDRPGDVIKASESANPNATALFDVCDWGRALSEGDVRYSPQSFVAGDLQLATGSMRLGFFTQENTLYSPSESSWVRLIWDYPTMSSWFGVTLDVGKIRATWFHETAGGTVCEIDRTGEVQHVSLIVGADGSVSLSDGDQTATGTLSLPSEWQSDPLMAMRVFTDWLKPMIGGVYVDRGEEHLPGVWERTAFLRGALDAGTGGEELSVWPAKTVTPLEVLKSHSEALGSAFWADSQGRVHWWRAERLLAQTPAKTLTSTDDLLTLGWQFSAGDSYGGVRFSYSEMAIERSWSNLPTVTLWSQNSVQVLGSNEVQEVFMTPASNEAWLFVDTDVKSANDPGSKSWLEAGAGTFSSGLIQEDGQPEVSADTTLWTTLTTLGPGNGFKVRMESLALGAGQQIAVKTPDAGLRAEWLDKPLPILRGFNKATWTSEEVTSGEVSQNARKPILERDAGLWVQSKNGAQDQADWWANLVTAGLPQLQSIQIVPDMELMPGQVVWVRDEHHEHVRLKALVTRTDQAWSPGDISMSIGCWLISAEGL